MWRYPASSAQVTARSHSGPSGTCQTPSPSSGIRLPSSSARTRSSACMLVSFSFAATTAGLPRRRVHDAGQRRGAGELRGHRVDALLRVGVVGQRRALGPPLGLLEAERALEVALERLLGLAVAVERPHELRVAERQRVAGLAVVAPGVPGVPGLAVAVHQLLHQLALDALRQPGGPELAGRAPEVG